MALASHLVCGDCEKGGLPSQPTTFQSVLSSGHIRMLFRLRARAQRIVAFVMTPQVMEPIAARRSKWGLYMGVAEEQLRLQ
jgi:hypothetical protein